MPQVEIAIGGRTFEVACQDGEEHFLQTAAKMLDEEAQHIATQVGRMPEARMLLMAGLMLADKTASLEERLSSGDTRVARLQARIDELEAGVTSGSVAAEPVEVPVVPSGLADAMSQIAARAEAIASVVEERAGEGQ
ncbi:MAG: cell division protein ZapA [Pseudomonadota bacterium]